MSKKIKRNIALICVVCLFVGVLSGFTYAADDEEDTEFVITYTEVPIYVDDVLYGDGLKIDATTYVPIRAFCEALNEETEVSWEPETSTAAVSMDGLSITLCINDNYMTANDRFLYLKDGAYNINGTVVVPIRELCKAFGLEVVWSNQDSKIEISTENLAYIMSGDEFYNEEDIYWLSRIINAESGNQPMDGKIGVGNVVINRVADPTCPNTIYDVIFDSRYGVQFSPTETGGVYIEPNEESVAAAKMCIEGYNTVGSSLFFLNPEISSTSWFSSNRTFVASIGEHYFYS